MVMINNLDTICGFMDCQAEEMRPGFFHPVSLVIRRKDFADHAAIDVFKTRGRRSQEYFIRHWLVRSSKELRDRFEAMSRWADMFHGRLYFGLDAKDLKKVLSAQIAFEAGELSDIDESSVSAYCHSFHSIPRQSETSVTALRCFMVDADVAPGAGGAEVAAAAENLKRIAESASPFRVFVFPSKTGFHLAGRIRGAGGSADLRRFEAHFAEYLADDSCPLTEASLKKNSMVNLYMNTLQ